MTEHKNIALIIGEEPNRDREYPPQYCVGSDGVTRIEYHVIGYGDHGIGEFRVYRGDVHYATLMHRYVSEIRYLSTSEED